MKHLIKFLFVIVLLSLVGCSKDNTINQPEPAGVGKMSMKIDRENAPQDVFLISATLTRDGFQTITSNMSLLSDSSATTTINEIEAGSWHLKVDAFNANNVVVYSGETDVSISAGATTSVTLQLIPTGNSYGQINIVVTWGSSTKMWIDYPANPILSPSNNSYDFGGVLQSIVYRADDKYIMWYGGVSGNGVKHIFYAESPNGLNWSKPYSNPILYPSPSGWDSWAVHTGPVIKDDGIFRMYYNAGSSQTGNWHIGLATSSDGKTWFKLQTPVVYSNSINWAPQIIAGALIKTDGVFYLYFTGRNLPSCQIGVATSSDGTNWNVRSNPVLIPSQSWEGTGVAYPSVIIEEGIFKMVYANVNPTYTAFGIATSVDGINWSKEATQPFFRLNQTHNHWCTSYIAYPCFNIYD
ncbi:MAG: hypothetical protein K8H86_10840, partial [Ignavibacteriaceae bacterium]|nr:hypothetical protein [Ignavibacteriaceae bacterium]